MTLKRTTKIEIVLSSDHLKSLTNFYILLFKIEKKVGKKSKTKKRSPKGNNIDPQSGSFFLLNLSYY